MEKRNKKKMMITYDGDDGDVENVEDDYYYI